MTVHETSPGTSREDGGVDLHAIRHGDGLPVRFVLVHGLSSNARMWDGVGAALAERGFGSVAVDLRGHGESPKPDGGYDFDSVVGDLAPLLVDRPVVVGQSYGGNVVVALAARHPDLVQGIVCVDGGAIDLRERMPSLDEAIEAMKPPYHLFEGRPWEEHEARARAMFEAWPETGVAGQLANLEPDQDGNVRARLRWPRHRQIIEAMWNEPPTPHFSTIRVPVLFLMATERMRPAVDAALGALPDAKAVWFEGAHHDVHAQRPVEVAEELIGFHARRAGMSPQS
jgi:pimeloyl-ACP methyl ester carboxylesterase